MWYSSSIDRFYVILHEWIAFCGAFLNIHRNGVLTAISSIMYYDFESYICGYFSCVGGVLSYIRGLWPLCPTCVKPQHVQVTPCPPCIKPSPGDPLPYMCKTRPVQVTPCPTHVKPRPVQATPCPTCVKPSPGDPLTYMCKTQPRWPLSLHV